MNETMVKYLAGLMDADGSLSLTFRQHGEKSYLTLRLTIASSDAVDVHGFVENLPNTLGMGGTYRYGKNQQFKTWCVQRRNDLEMLLPRLIKHMLIKGKHWQWLLDTWRAYRGKAIDPGTVEDLRGQAKFSRAVSGPVKPKNYPTWAWMAGFMDGDGYYSCRWRTKTNCWHMRIGCVIHKNDLHVLKLIQKAYGGSIYRSDANPNCAFWGRGVGVSQSSFALKFLGKMAKFAKLKRHKIDHMIHIHQQRLSAPTPAGEATV